MSYNTKEEARDPRATAEKPASLARVSGKRTHRTTRNKRGSVRRIPLSHEEERYNDEIPDPDETIPE